MAKILIVDDSIVMRKNLATILTNDGHEIIGEASNGRQAVKLYEELQPDLVTMDISMPIMSGVEAVEQIIALDGSAKIIMVSAVNQKKMVFTAINAGAMHYIIKPIDSKKVLGVVHEVLEISVDAIESVSSEKEQGFSIVNEHGEFVVYFNGYMTEEDFPLLDMAIKGILFIQPLVVSFNFDNANNLNQDLMNRIKSLGEKILKSNGKITYIGL